MLQRLAALARRHHHRHLLLCPRLVLRRTLCDQSQAVGIDSSQLLRVCTVLYQQRDASDAHLHSHLQKCEFNLTHEFFLQVCNKFLFSKIWNVMVEEGFVPEIEACNEMIETFFKNNKGVEAVKLFMSMREKKPDLGLSTYRILITWFCKQEKVEQAFHMFDEMNKRGIAADNCIYAALIFGLGNKGRVKEAYKMLEGVEIPDVGVYHGMIKALVNLKRPGEATEVFRRMILRGCEPTMHTYIMLLQGHLGKKGRKGPHASVNFDTVFVGGLVKKGKSLEACKYLERMINRGTEVPRFDFNKFLYLFSDEEGIEMFEEIGKRLREVGLNDLADIFVRYGETMTTRDRRRRRRIEVVPLSSC